MVTDEYGNRNGVAQIAGDSPAFPTHEAAAWGGQGMSLRDWFAGQALQGGAAGRPGTPQEIAEFAYRCADLMIEARKA